MSVTAIDSIRLTLSHHETTGYAAPKEMAFQMVTIELVSRDRLTTPEALQSLVLPAGIDPRKGVVISGRAPQWVVAYLTHECHPTRWVACFDPRLGAVVVATHSPQVSVGQVIPFEVLGIQAETALSSGQKTTQKEPELGKALLIVGPPDSGKSVLSHQLFSTLVKDYPDIYLQRAQWDGEGNWILELPKTATDAQREAFKQANKGGMTTQFFAYQGEAITNLRRQKRLVIVDAGGMVQPEKKGIVDACSHYLIISAQPEEIEPWHQFCHGEGGLVPVAVVHSVLEDRLEILQEAPFLEMVCGPWVMGHNNRQQTTDVPEVLRSAVERLFIHC